MSEKAAVPRRRPAGAACWLVLMAAAALWPASAAARKHEAPTAPGKYSDWNDIDEVEILASWKLAGYQRVLVMPLDTAGVELPAADDNTYEPVKVMLAGATPPLVTGLAGNLRPGLEVLSPAPGAPGGEAPPPAGGPGTLLIRGKVLKMDPGSRAARYWGGFGAGAAKTKVTGEVVDAESGSVLVRFTQERRSGFGLAGGGYVEMMSRNLREIGEDLAHLLSAF